ncbi:MAG: preprotein translocase subunit SecY [Thermoplasmata archaeon]
MADDEEKKSILFKLKPIIEKWPSVKKPDTHVHFKQKMAWTFGILGLYYFLVNIYIFGLGDTMDMFSQYRAIMAGASGSLMHLGIGPIVTGSIIMQLFTGAKIISLDLTKPEDKAIYQGTQKILVVVMIFVEAIPQVYGYLQPADSFVAGLNVAIPGWGSGIAKTLIVLQLAIGSYLVFLMDELVSKWGIGSGISMFIAAGVAEATFTGLVNWEAVSSAEKMSVSNPPAGLFPKTFYLFTELSMAQMNTGGFEVLFLRQPNPMIALVGTVIVFIIVAYTESSRIELPLTHAKVRGYRGRYPIRLIYASNIPVILMSALLANINMFSLLLWSHPTLSKIPLIGHKKWIGEFPEPDSIYYQHSSTKPINGFAYYVSQINGVGEWLLPLWDFDTYGRYLYGRTYWEVFLHLVVYMGIMLLGSMMFAKFWIETTNMGSEDIAKQIENSGMQIPGFRRDPRVLKKVLDRYIPAVTLFSGAFVGLLAAGADLIGTIGNTSGTGVLLAVGIFIKMYEDIGKEQMMEMHPMLRSFFGGE